MTRVLDTVASVRMDLDTIDLLRDSRAPGKLDQLASELQEAASDIRKIRDREDDHRS
jgi:hypothetical protein